MSNLPQIQETGVIVDDFGHEATNTSTQVSEPPPGIIRNDIQWMASYISKGGLVVERTVMQFYVNDARYSFMWRSDPFHAFYQQRLNEYRSMNQKDGDYHDYDAAVKKAAELLSQNPHNYKASEDDDAAAQAQRIVLPYDIEFRLPKGMNGNEFRTMKLTAYFGAWYGNDFWLGFKNLAGFEFTDPTDSRFPRFTRFVLEYSEVLKLPKELKEKVSKSDAYMAAIHDGFFRLLHQWDSLQEIKWRDGGVMSMIDWHASLRKDFPNIEDLPPPGTGSGMSPKRQKIDEPAGFVPEDQFLAQHPGWCTIRISVVDVDGLELDVIEKTVQSLSENVASLKEKIAEEIGIPPEKEVLYGKSGLLKDNNRSLAHYNVGSGEILTLSLCMCGRETDMHKPCCCKEMHIKAADLMASHSATFN